MPIHGTTDYAVPTLRKREKNWEHRHQLGKVCPRCKRLDDVDVPITDKATVCRDCRNAIRSSHARQMRRLHEILAERALLQAEVDSIARGIRQVDRQTALKTCL